MATLRELLTAYAPGCVLEHEGERFVFVRLSPAQLGALAAAWRIVHGAGEVVKDPVNGVPLGEAFAHYLSDRGVLVLASAMTGREPALLAGLFGARPRDVRHAALCVLFASHAWGDALLSCEAGAEAKDLRADVKNLAGMIERALAGEV